MRHTLSSLPLLLALRVYRWIISPLLPPACRFYPTCSHYAIEAIQTHGARHGVLLTIKRLLACRPAGRSGFDPVPSHLPTRPKE